MELWYLGTARVGRGSEQAPTWYLSHNKTHPQQERAQERTHDDAEREPQRQEQRYEVRKHRNKEVLRMGKKMM